MNILCILCPVLWWLLCGVLASIGDILHCMQRGLRGRRCPGHRATRPPEGAYSHRTKDGSPGANESAGQLLVHGLTCRNT